MKLKDVVPTDSRVFIKSEWSPISDHWPTLSFSRQSVVDRLSRRFKPERDVVIYVGTGNAKTTGDPAHRKRLLSVIQVESTTPQDTRELIPNKSWEDAKREYGERWKWSLIPSRAWDIVNLPLAKEVIPASYSLLGKPENRGNIVEVLPHDRDVLFEIAITPVLLKKHPGSTMDDPALSREIERMLALMIERERRSGTESTSTNPVRTVSPGMKVTLRIAWDKQRGLCALCDGILIKGARNKLLRASADRIDSQNCAYDAGNLQITHLGCNLAKNDVTMLEFQAWLAVVRGVDKMIAKAARAAVP